MPTARTLPHLNQLNLFDPESPFVIMQRFIMDAEDKVKQLAGPAATIIGDFKPVTDPAIYPIPLFRDSDGNLLAFLWHGTSADNITGIADTSFLLSQVTRGLYGVGTYFAIQACKSLQYTGYEKTTLLKKKKHCLLLCAVFLGKRPFFTMHQGQTLDGSAPTSIIAIPGLANAGSQQHWEFVTQHEAAAMPILKIVYTEPRLFSRSTDFRHLHGCAVQ
jgi:hypothetical protein